MDLNATARMIRSNNERIILRRATGKGLHIDVRCPAYVTKFTLEMRAMIREAGGIAQGDRVIYISNQEIQQRKWPGPPRRGDTVILLDEGITVAVQTVDTQSAQGVAVRHDMTVRGPS